MYYQLAYMYFMYRKQRKFNHANTVFKMLLRLEHLAQYRGDTHKLFELIGIEESIYAYSSVYHSI